MTAFVRVHLHVHQRVWLLKIYVVVTIHLKSCFG